jgi:tetratricopeptide (TPR) repeat protein
LFTAYVHVAREAWDEALAHALQAESQFRKMEILYYLPEVLSLQAVIFLKLTGTGRGALQSATEALELTRLPERSSSYQEAIVLRALGMAEGSLGEISSAQTHLDESIQLLSKAGEPYDLAWSHLVLADLLVNAEEDRFDVAGQHVTAAEEIAQQLSSQRLHHAIEEVRSRLSARIGQQS